MQVLAHTKFNEMIRLSGKAVPAPDNEQEKWIDIIFSEQPYLSNVYPDNTRKIGIVFCVKNAEIEYFNLGVNPIFRELYTIGNEKIPFKGYKISENCIGCGACEKVCPRGVLKKTYRIKFVRITVCTAEHAMKNALLRRLKRLG